MEIIVRKPTDEEKEKLLTQPTWSSEVSEFDWHYDTKEQSLMLEGAVTVSYGERQVEIQAGDFVIFPEGLSCRWKVTKPLKKHYLLG